MERDRNDWQLTKNINLKELECPCCGRVMISHEGVLKLQKVRDETGFPIIFTSGYRCSVQNDFVGGYKKSLHLLGEAWDIVASNPKIQISIIAKYFPFYYHNKEKGYIHCQLREFPLSRHD